MLLPGVLWKTKCISEMLNWAHEVTKGKDGGQPAVERGRPRGLSFR